MEISKERKRTSHFPFEAATGRVLNVYSHEAVFSFCLFQSRSH